MMSANYTSKTERLDPPSFTARPVATPYQFNTDINLGQHNKH